MVLGEEVINRTSSCFMLDTRGNFTHYNGKLIRSILYVVNLFNPFDQNFIVFLGIKRCIKAPVMLQLVYMISRSNSLEK